MIHEEDFHWWVACGCQDDKEGVGIFIGPILHLLIGYFII